MIPTWMKTLSMSLIISSQRFPPSSFWKTCEYCLQYKIHYKNMWMHININNAATTSKINQNLREASMLKRCLARLMYNAKVKVSGSPGLNRHIFQRTNWYTKIAIKHFSTAISPSPSFVNINEAPTPEPPFAISLKILLQVVQGPLHILPQPWSSGWNQQLHVRRNFYHLKIFKLIWLLKTMSPKCILSKLILLLKTIAPKCILSKPNKI